MAGVEGPEPDLLVRSQIPHFKSNPYRIDNKRFGACLDFR